MLQVGNSAPDIGMAIHDLTIDENKALRVDLRNYATLRPTAGAIMRNSSINLANCSGKSDCAPSENALSGS